MRHGVKPITAIDLPPSNSCLSLEARFTEPELWRSQSFTFIENALNPHR
jgi:hypothetical protein